MPALLGTRRVPYLGGAWTPARLPGLVLWLDAATVGQADNTSVASWRDQSGKGNHATQGTVAHQPTFHTNQVGGAPGVVSDGVDDELLLPVAAMPGAGPSSLFVVARSLDQAGNIARLVLFPNQLGIYSRADVATAWGTWNGAWRYGGGVVAAWSVLAVVGYSIASTDLVQNGVRTSVAGGSSWDVLGRAAVFSSGGASFGQVALAHALLWSRALSLPEQAQVTRWLGQRYGVAVQ